MLKEKFGNFSEKLVKFSGSLSPKAQVIIFLSLFFVLISFFAWLNYTINPYGVFNHHLNVCDVYDRSCDREIIYPKIKASRYIDYDYVFCGSSALLTNLSEESFERMFPDKTIFKLAVTAVVASEQYDLIKNFIKANPEVKKIFVAVDFDEMTNSTENQLPEYGENKLNGEELRFLLLSFETLKFTLNTVFTTFKEITVPTFMFSLKRDSFFSKFKIFREYRYKVVTNHNRWPKRRFADWNNRKINQPLFEHLKKIKELCDEKNVEVVFYTSPLHSYAIYDIYNQNVYNEVENFKKELVKVSPFYDFLHVCDYSDKPISVNNKYWNDALHSDKALGDEILNKLVNGKGNYGIYVTPDNIEKVLKTNREALFAFAKREKKALDEYVSYGHLDDSCEEEIIYYEE